MNAKFLLSVLVVSSLSSISFAGRNSAMHEIQDCFKGIEKQKSNSASTTKSLVCAVHLMSSAGFSVLSAMSGDVDKNVYNQASPAAALIIADFENGGGNLESILNANSNNESLIAALYAVSQMPGNEEMSLLDGAKVVIWLANQN